ncbi:MAG: hypothetical protein ACRDXX_08230, partial [Stackebrandtia sp.]
GDDGETAGEESVVVDCVTPPEPVDDTPLEAESFYSDDPWTPSEEAPVSTPVDQVDNWNHTDCCDVGLADAQSVLNEAQCGYGIEAAYSSRDGEVGIGQLVLAFEDESGAWLASDDIQPLSFKMQPDTGMYEEDNELYAWKQVSGNYLVVTVGVVGTTDEQAIEEAITLVADFHDDHLMALPMA